MSAGRAWPLCLQPMTAHRCASLAELVLSFTVCFIVLVTAPLLVGCWKTSVSYTVAMTSVVPVASENTTRNTGTRTNGRRDRHTDRCWIVSLLLPRPVHPPSPVPARWQIVAKGGYVTIFSSRLRAPTKCWPLIYSVAPSTRRSRPATVYVYIPATMSAIQLHEVSISRLTLLSLGSDTSFSLYLHFIVAK